MVCRVAAAVVCLGLSSACGGGDPAEMDVTQREATGAECDHGGLVLSVNGEDQPAVCNGTDGVDGVDGAPGADGAQGDPGATGATGARGVSGIPGANGTNGANGAPGTTGLSATAQVAETISCITAKRASLVQSKLLERRELLV